MIKSHLITIIPSMNLHVLLLMFLLHDGVKGFVDMTCSPTDTALGAASTCTCTTDSGTGIAWQKDGTDIMVCFIGGTCDNNVAGYSNGYSTSGTNKIFTLTITAFAYSDCSVLTCKDQDTAETQSETLSVYEFSGGVPSITTEPGSGNDGNIEITTDCLYPESDIVVKWYSVDGSTSKEITSEVKSSKTPVTCSDATKVCSGSNAVTLNISFPHTEKKDGCANIKIEVYRLADPSTKLEWTTTGIYCIEDATPSPTGPDPECIILAILSAVFGGLAFIILIVLIVAIWKGLGRNFLLVLDGTDIATFTIGIVLGIVVHTYDDCPNWATNLATAVIVISCIGIVCDIISILYIVFGPGVPTEDDLSMTPANTKKKTESFKSFEKEQLRLKIPQDPMNWNETQVEQWLNWAKNEFTLESLKVNNFKMPGSELCRMDMEKFLILAQHNKCDILWIHLDTMKKAGKKGASETRTAPRPQPSKPSQGALSDREESDSALSRKDIELQGNFRKMPPIPVTDKAMHDSKGRGLSANFDDDDHPIAGVDTPDRRAGALEPVREKLEPVRGKPKKLKKNKVDEEVMNTNSHNM